MSALTAFPTALAVASSAARPRAGAARASRAARARDVVRSDARLVASPSRRGVRCAAEKGGEAEKTVSALDAILAGSQDEPEPEPEEPAPKPDPNERKPGEVSEAMKARLRDEYVGLGGTPSKPMPSNLFLNIILGISALAVLCKLGGIL